MRLRASISADLPVAMKRLNESSGIFHAALSRVEGGNVEYIPAVSGAKRGGRK